jgi:two-component system alkaline phosphatase synthesis response regulator PhoP
MQKKILIIEDNPGIQMSLTDEFQSAGYAVFTASSGIEGLEFTREKEPDLIILDIMLPELDGYEVCKQLRAEGNHTPIIMLTVKNTEIDKVLGLELGADDYVTKPFSVRELSARVKTIFRRIDSYAADTSIASVGDTTINF